MGTGEYRGGRGSKPWLGEQQVWVEPQRLDGQE